MVQSGAVTSSKGGNRRGTGKTRTGDAKRGQVQVAGLSAESSDESGEEQMGECSADESEEPEDTPTRADNNDNDNNIDSDSGEEDDPVTMSRDAGGKNEERSLNTGTQKKSTPSKKAESPKSSNKTKEEKKEEKAAAAEEEAALAVAIPDNAFTFESTVELLKTTMGKHRENKFDEADDATTNATKATGRAEVVVGYERIAFMFSALLEGKMLRAGSIANAEATRDKADAASKKETLLGHTDPAEVATLRAEEVAARATIRPSP